MQTTNGLCLSLIALGGCGFLLEPGNAARAAESSDAVVAALQASIAKNIVHAREWLDAGDYKSLAQSAGGLQFLVELLRTKSDDSLWQETVGNVLSAAKEVQSAAGSGDAAKCLKALELLEQAVALAAKGKPGGQPQPLPRPMGSVRPVMLVMDAVRGDAKVALLSGDVQGAKKGAYVLSELGRVVSNSPSGNAKNRERWPELAGGFVEAALATARSPAEDAATVRQLMRGVSQRCEACHETR
jgi:hypothetical protein